MLSHVLRTISRHKLLGDHHAAELAGGLGKPDYTKSVARDRPDSSRRVLCAVSGGPDSMALLACLWELAPRLKLHLEVATVDHGLRPEAAAELQLVADRASALSIPWYPVRVDVGAARASEQGDGRLRQRGGVQEVARRLRLAALAELADRRELGRVALGHNADDQSETVLFRVLRGTGPRGLAGIPYRRGPFIRPLLDVTRAEILAYLARRSVPYAIDPSNSDVRYTRARLRHHILPLLRQENPRVDVALRTLAAAVATEFKTEDQNTESGPERSLDANAERSRDDLHIPTRMAAQIEDAVRDGRGTRRFDLPAGLRVQVAYGQITMAHVTEGGAQPSVGSYDDGESGEGRGGTAAPVSLPGPGTYPFGAGVRIQILEAAGELDAEADSDELSGFDADLLSWPLIARPRRPGDRMSPRGGVGSRKLSDLMIDAKIPRGERASLPVITAADGELLFVPGLRPSRRGCPTLATMRRIGLAVLPKPDHDSRIDGQVDRSIRRSDTGRYRCQDRHPPAPAGQAESEETGAGLQSCSSQSAKRSGTNPAKKPARNPAR